MASETEWVMSGFTILMIAGWTSTLAMFGYFAFRESGKLAVIRQRVAQWLETSGPSAEGSPQPESRDAA